MGLINNLFIQAYDSGLKRLLRGVFASKVELSSKQDAINDLATIRSGAAAGATAVQPSVMNTALVNTVAESGVYDVTANNSGATFASLNALLSAQNLDTLIPVAKRKGGMSIKFVQSSDNKYVQFRYMLEYENTTAGNNAFKNISNWQGVDKLPTPNSQNLVESKGIYSTTHILTQILFESDENKSAIIPSGVTQNGTWNGSGKTIYKKIKGDALKVIGGTNSTSVTIVNQKPSTSIQPNTIFATGETGRHDVLANQEVIIPIASDAEYAIIGYKSSGGADILPSYFGYYQLDEDCIKEVQSDIKYLSSLTTHPENIGLDTGYENNKYIINSSTRTWSSGNNGILFIPVGKYSKLKITGNSQRQVFYTILSSKDITSGQVADFAYGFSSVISIPTGQDVVIELSEGAEYLYLLKKAGGNDCLPAEIVGYVFSARNSVDNITKKISEETFDENKQLSIDLAEQEKVNAVIGADGYWHPTSYGSYGKSTIIPCIPSYLALYFQTEYTNSFSFLTELPTSYSSVTKAKFVEGETGRRVATIGNNKYDIPYGTRYIVIQTETSEGASMAPTNVYVMNNTAVEASIVRTKELISVSGQFEKDGAYYLNNMPNLAPISDPLKTRSSGECNVYYEVSTGLVYMTAIEGENHLYEALDVVSLYVFSLTNPNNVKRYQFARKISDSKKCYTPNIVPIGTKQVRVFYSIQNEDSGYCYYRDFNFNTETFTEPQKATLSISGDLTNIMIDSSFHDGDILTGNIIRQFTIDNSGTTGSEVTSGKFIYIQKITEVMADGYRYATLCCGESISYNLVLARSNNNFASIELVAILPYLTRYDCAVAELNNKLYFVHRVAGDEYAATSGSAMFTADITDLNNIVWSADTKFAEGDSRTDCYQYDNKIYLMAGNYHSVSGKPMRISSSVWEGTSDNPSDYTKVLEVNDSRGVQNPRVFRYGCGDYGVLMQNSPARIDYPTMGHTQWQFKTAVCFVHTRIN